MVEKGRQSTRTVHIKKISLLDQMEKCSLYLEFCFDIFQVHCRSKDIRRGLWPLWIDSWPQRVPSQHSNYTDWIGQSPGAFNYFFIFESCFNFVQGTLSEDLNNGLVR